MTVAELAVLQDERRKSAVTRDVYGMGQQSCSSDGTVPPRADYTTGNGMIRKAK